MSTLTASLELKRQVCTATTFENPVNFYMEILVGWPALVSSCQKRNLKSDVDGLTLTKQLLNLFCIVNISRDSS